MNAVHVIALEVSSSSAKCALFSSKQGIIRTVERRLSADVTDGLTQDPDRMTAVALDTLRELVSQIDVPVDAIGLSGTWHSLLLLDQDKLPLHRISTWADLQSAPTAAKARQDKGFVQEFYHKTGCMAHAMYPLFKYWHLTKTSPELTCRARYVSSQIEYLFLKLTGEQAVSRSSAAGSGFFNLHTLHWDQELLDLVGLSEEQLGNLDDAFYVGGLSAAAAQHVGLPSGTPVTVGMPDGALNQVAVGGARQGVMSFSVGTSGALRLALHEPALPDEPSTWCYYLLDGFYLAGAATNATNNVEWFMRNFAGPDQDYTALGQAAAGVDPAKAPLFLPFIYGERCPGWGENRLGGFVGLKPHHGVAEMYYAVLEGILFNLYHCYEILAETAGEPAQILVSGGIMNSKSWLQMASDIFGRELFTTGVKNDSTFGAALVAAAAVSGGAEALHELTAKITAAPACQPREVELTKLYRRRYDMYLDVYDSLATVRRY